MTDRPKDGHKSRFLLYIDRGERLGRVDSEKTAIVVIRQQDGLFKHYYPQLKKANFETKLEPAVCREISCGFFS